MEEKQQKNFSTPRLVIGIISIILFVIISLQSCVAGIGNVLSNSGEVSGTSGLLLSVSFLVSGIVSVCLRKRSSKSAFIVPSCFYLIGSVIASLTFGTYSDLAVWAGLGALFGTLYLFFMFKLHSSNKVIMYVVPVALFIFILVIINAMGTSNTENLESKDIKKVEIENVENEDIENKKIENENDENSSGETKEKEVSKKEDNNKPFDLNTENIAIKYTGYEVAKDFDGKDCLVVYYDFTNKSDEIISASMGAYIQAFQKGIECDTAYIDENEAFENADKDIKKGTTIKAASVFAIKDTSDVELEVSEAFSLEDVKSKMTIKIK